VPILLDQAQLQTVHLGLASQGWRLCLGSGYSQEQQRQHRKAHHGALPEPHLPHHDPSVATQSPRESLSTLTPASAGLLCLSHALGKGGLALRRPRPEGADAVVRCSCWYHARAVVSQALPDGVRSTWL